MSKIINYINKISISYNLSLAESEELFQIILNNGASQAQIASILTSFKIKSESDLELLAYIKNLLEKSKYKPELDINICSTDINNRRNLEAVILTSNLIASQAKFKIAKYIHKSLSYTSDMFKFIKALGINYRNLSPEIATKSLQENNIGLFTTDFMRNLYNITDNMEEINIKPLLYLMPNICLPNLAKNIILLVESAKQADLFAKIFANFPDVKIWLIYNDFNYIGLISDQPNYVLELQNNVKKKFIIDLKPYEFQPLGQIDLIYNSNHAREIIFGQTNIFRNLVMIYTGLHFMIKENYSLNNAMIKSEEIIRSGKSLDLLTKLINLINLVES